MLEAASVQLIHSQTCIYDHLRIVSTCQLQTGWLSPFKIRITVCTKETWKLCPFEKCELRTYPRSPTDGLSDSGVLIKSHKRLFNMFNALPQCGFRATYEQMKNDLD